MTGVHTTASDSGLKAVQNEPVQSFLCLLGPEQLSNPRRSSGLRMNHASGIQLLSVFATANEESRDSCTRTWRIHFSARASKKLPGSQGLEKLSSRQRQRRERPERQRRGSGLQARGHARNHRGQQQPTQHGNGNRRAALNCRTHLSQPQVKAKRQDLSVQSSMHAARKAPPEN